MTNVLLVLAFLIPWIVCLLSLLSVTFIGGGEGLCKE